MFFSLEAMAFIIFPCDLRESMASLKILKNSLTLFLQNIALASGIQGIQTLLQDCWS